MEKLTSLSKTFTEVTCQTDSLPTAPVLVSVGTDCADILGQSVPAATGAETCTEVACQTDSLPMANVSVSVGTDCADILGQSVSAATEAETWAQVTRRGSRPPQEAPTNPANEGASGGIPVRNRFSALADDNSNASGSDVGQAVGESVEVHLIGDSIVRGVRVGIRGRSTTWCYPGTRVEHLATRIGTVLSKASSEPVVVVHAGTNNITMSDSAKGVAERLRHLVKEIHRVKPGARVILSTVLPRFDGGPRGSRHPNPVVKRISREISRVCTQENLMFVDAGPELLNDPDSHYLKDGLHLTSEGKMVLSSVLNKAVVKLAQGN